MRVWQLQVKEAVNIALVESEPPPHPHIKKLGPHLDTTERSKKENTSEHDHSGRQDVWLIIYWVSLKEHAKYIYIYFPLFIKKQKYGIWYFHVVASRITVGHILPGHKATCSQETLHTKAPQEAGNVKNWLDNFLLNTQSIQYTQ